MLLLRFVKRQMLETLITISRDSSTFGSLGHSRFFFIWEKFFTFIQKTICLNAAPFGLTNRKRINFHVNELVPYAHSFHLLSLFIEIAEYIIFMPPFSTRL